MKFDVTVIIATALQRTDWLINRSLKSVYLQTGINKEICKIIIVDDNRKEKELSIIQNKVSELREAFEVSGFSTEVIRNERTRFMSGTGAWNTGILKAYKDNPDGYVAILDDDDEFLPNHLSDCLSQLNHKTGAVFQRLFWQNNDGSVMHLPFKLNDITPESFYIGNPGIQGSNMFFKTKILVEISGFDENLPNTTDRDLMIRFLWHLKETDSYDFKVLENIGVKHYNHQKEKVNNNFNLKHQGLNLFYKKYQSYFSIDAYEKSLVRAKRYFNYTPPKSK